MVTRIPSLLALILLLLSPGPAEDLQALARAATLQEGTVLEALPVAEVAPEPRLAVDDELDALAVELAVPERYAGHVGAWRVERRSFAFVHHPDRVKESRFTLVWDGPRLVAILRSGDILLVGRRPDDAPTTVALPTERLHLDNLPGPSLPTWPFFKKVDTHGSIYRDLGDKALVTERWERSPAHLALIRQQELPDYRLTARFVFSCDPVYGYRVDAVRELSFTAPPPADLKLGAGTFCPDCYVPWAYAARYERTVHTPSAGGWRGWANNCVVMDRCDAERGSFDWRDRGFIAYLTSRDGWGTAFTRSDGAGPTRKLSVCNAHNDFHITLHVPDGLSADAEGRYPYRYVHRLLQVPPEISARVWDGMELIHAGGSAVVLDLGTVDSFEDDPAPLGEGRRGLIWTSGGPEVVTGAARSGERCLRIRGRMWPNLPQVSLLPGQRYVLEGWYRLEPWDAERVAQEREADERRRARLAEKGKPLPPPVDWDGQQGRAWIQGDFYEWSPYTGPMLTMQRSTEATVAAGDGWQHVALEFTAPAWGPFINIAFHAEHCDALLDDFSLRIVE